MRKRLINGRDFTAMAISAAALLRQRAEEINRLNVFPVPDGDTGSNMSRTLEAGVERIATEKYVKIGEVAKALADGMLMGARGNSGVILSQLIQGFAKAIADERTLTVRHMAEALQAGVEAAYRAVTNPVEGTILTVAREAASFGLNTVMHDRDAVAWWAAVVEKARLALEMTPEQLPILKQAGVVDSGAQGLVYVYEGFLAACSGQPIETWTTKQQTEDQPTQRMVNHGVSKVAVEDIEHFYDMEFFIRNDQSPLTSGADERLRKQLMQQGDSVLVVPNEQFIKVHVHSRAPGEVLNIALTYGELTKIHIENMRDQHDEWVANDRQKQRLEQGVVAVSAGSGMADIFRSLGVARVVSGGQSMNPSVAELLQAVREVHADTVYLLPNNKNIQLAAQRTAELADATVVVIPTTTMPQGLATMLAFDEQQTIEANQQAMLDAIQEVKSGYVTYAVKETNHDGSAIKTGDLLGIYEGQIVCVDEDLHTICYELLSHMIDEDDELVTIFYGQEIDQKQAEQLLDELQATCSSVEIELVNGGQPLHYYLFSVE